MNEFLCRVATPNGEVFERSYNAADETALRRDLESQDLMILNVRKRNPVFQQLARTFRLKGKVSSRDFLIFNQEFSALVRAGLPILPSLDILLERRKNPTFKQSLLDVRDRIKSGEALSEAFEAQGELYPPLYSASLASGERSGELAGVLTRFIAYTQKVIGIQRKVVSALIYPLILFILAVVLILLMLFFIIPKFQTFLADMGAELPLLTKVVVGIAMFSKANWQAILIASVAGTLAFMFWSRTDRGQFSVDRWKMHLPIVGGIVKNYAQNRFTRTLGILQSGGIPLVTSLELSAKAVGNRVFEAELTKVVARVREGQELWESLDDTGLLSDITVQMIKVGESTGALVEMLENSSDFSDEEIDTQLSRMVTMIEPLMLVFMACVVAVMLLSIYLPLIQAYGGIKG
ncbi:MAG: type II secretion system F family protein [bacterium]|nr:type II secretion system F family protein [bacterium]